MPSLEGNGGLIERRSGTAPQASSEIAISIESQSLFHPISCDHRPSPTS